jgi:sterol desaturase/sphingolipid hydroxylase (fatty acid hydroxylase superfamily)
MALYLKAHGRHQNNRAGRLLERLAAHKSNYWLGFVTDPATALFFIFWDGTKLHVGLYAAAACYILGLLSWTLLEYSFHRWIYHRSRTLAHAGHRMHHESPKTLIGMPWFMTTGFLWGVWLVFAELLHVRFFLSFMAGLVTGFLVYGLFHHLHHHFNLNNSWYRKLKAHHNIHHQLPDVNFGVTVWFWDYVFGTIYRKGERKREHAARVGREV